jgi:hypothetical protein
MANSKLARSTVNLEGAPLKAFYTMQDVDLEIHPLKVRNK